MKVSGGWNQYDQIVGLSDIDGDGDADVLGRTYTGELFLHKGTGNGASPFEWRTQIATGWTGYTQIIAADDIDGDGKADMMGVTPTGDLFCHFSEGNGLFSQQYDCGSNWKSTELFLGAGITPVYGKHNVGTVDAASTSTGRTTTRATARSSSRASPATSSGRTTAPSWSASAAWTRPAGATSSSSTSGV